MPVLSAVVANLAAYAALLGSSDEPDNLARLLATALPQWHRDALCREHPEVSFFTELGASTAPAKALCRRCLVRDECLSYALADPHLEGIWGGTGPRERARLRRTQKAA